MYKCIVTSFFDMFLFLFFITEEFLMCLVGEVVHLCFCRYTVTGPWKKRNFCEEKKCVNIASFGAAEMSQILLRTQLSAFLQITSLSVTKILLLFSGHFSQVGVDSRCAQFPAYIFV